MSPLSHVPIAARRRLEMTLALFAILLVAVGAVSALGAVAGHGSAAAPVFSVIACVVAALLALIAWGVHSTIRLDLAEARIDHAIAESVPGEVLACGCGHVHDADELHVTDAVDAPCAHDVGGATCNHDCETCVLAALRSSAAPTS